MENKYYHRQVILPEIGIEGQKNIANCKVLVVGAGGLGCPALEFLTRAGIGSIGIVDFDTVDISNLHRQSLYTIDDVGKPKTEVAIQRLAKVNSDVKLKGFNHKVHTDNILQLISDYDIVIDATDNYPTRYLINDACVVLDKPLVYGAIYRFEGQVSVFNYQKGATYRCIFPEFPSSLSNVNCSTSGVIGVLPGIIGIMQANEVIKFALGSKHILSNILLTYNALTGTTTKIKFKRSDNFNYDSVFLNGTLSNPYYEESCTLIEEIDEQELNNYHKDGSSIKFIDVRECGEFPEFENDDVLQIPLSHLHKLDLLPNADKIVVFCKSGIRSERGVQILTNQFPNRKILNLKNGINLNIIEKWNQQKK